MANLAKRPTAVKGLAYARKLAMGSGVPQPTANVRVMQRGAQSTPQAFDQVASGMDNLYDWAQLHGPQQGSGYGITGLETQGGLADASMQRTSLDELLAKKKYGGAYPEVRESMLAADEYPSLMYPGAKSQEEFLANPFYVLMAQDPASSGQIANAMILSPGQAKRHHVPLSRIGQHELGHATTQIGSYSGRKPLVEQQALMDQLARDYPDLAARDKIFPKFAKRLEYMSDPNELAANLNHMRGLNYGVTGNPLLTPEDRIRFIQQFGDAPIRDPGEPSMFPDTMFPGDPMMQHGPNAGKPAQGYNFMEQGLRQIIPRLSPRQMKALESIFNKGASASEVEPGYV